MFLAKPKMPSLGSAEGNQLFISDNSIPIGKLYKEKIVELLTN